MSHADRLLEKIDGKKAVVGVMGLGYVGLPLVLAFHEAGFPVVGFDVDEKKCHALNRGDSYITHIPTARVQRMVARGGFTATTELARLAEPDGILICVPTPLNAHREPDLRYVLETGRALGCRLHPGQLVILESTTYPGTTDTDLRRVLEQESGLTAGLDFFLAFSPEREDPNNADYHTVTIPKVVGGLTADCLRVADRLYGHAVRQTVPVSSTRVAEASKILENTYRAINIALVNELKILFDRMDIDIWEVIEAAKTKPFGFQPFYPGPGLGGHCIPIDPFYLTWKAREYEVTTRFIELAGEVNTGMPGYVVRKCAQVLNRQRKSLNGSRVLILGMAYKKNIDDFRESPTLKLLELLTGEGAEVDYHDPLIPHYVGSRRYPHVRLSSISLTPDQVASYDLVLLSTDHDGLDYAMVAANARQIVDTRNLFGRLGLAAPHIHKA